ncbi:hypothetical protein [Pseudofulvibacter geojedonensis]|uniref:Lipocalin-like domain-containing protein n=1 Tax=Pseudofulvibacter geojedonensis TaxID=1123758 RepID=A0ABW3HZ59_9FLAO
MKKLNLLLTFFIGLLLFLSCSSDNDNSNDIIIGKWKLIEKYESDIQVSPDECLLFWYDEYKADKSILSNYIDSVDYPDDCFIEAELGWTWKNIGNNKYLIKHVNNNYGVEYIIYKEGANLVMEHPDDITKTVYEPY